MSNVNSAIENLSINTIRFLSVDGVQKANSGHPGMPMGCAPIAYLLYKNLMKHNPANPKWFNRDRFILSAGHGSMLLYSSLHLSGYDISMDDLKNFRQWGSITPGHPEYGMTPGVETTTGPLGQGLTNAIGMAISQSYIAAKFNKDDYKLIDHNIYVIASDGDLMEGVTHEAASFAGHNKLGSLIVFYDNNKITIDGDLDLSMSEDVGKRFDAYDWHVQYVDDVNDLSELQEAVAKAKSASDKPSIIITNTHIGFGSPNKQDKSSSHGSPLGDEEIALTKKKLNWEYEESFIIPDEVQEHFKNIKTEGSNQEEEWNKLVADYSTKYKDDHDLFVITMNNDFGTEWVDALPKFENYNDKIATRSASGKVLNAISSKLPSLIGGSADLTPSNNTLSNSFTDYSATNPVGNYIHYGIREHAMASMMNGMVLYGGVIPYGGTFLIFSDYLRPAIRLASLSHLNPIYVFTHDSIGLGEDGPTHQPIEQLASLRTIPGLTVLRPADANETTFAWKAALDQKNGPVALALTRQGLTILDRNKYGAAEGTLKGAYILKDSESKPELIIIATGSEVEIAIEASDELQKQGKQVRVVSMPSCELFDKQSDEYKEEVLPSSVENRISIEAGVGLGWSKYVGMKGEVISIEKFGASAPYKTLFEEYGMTANNIIDKANSLLK